MPKDKEVAEKKDVSHKEIEKLTNLFNLEVEVAKLKISIPLGELVRNDQYIFQILKALKVDKTSNRVNI